MQPSLRGPEVSGEPSLEGRHSSTPHRVTALNLLLTVFQHVPGKGLSILTVDNTLGQQLLNAPA